MKKERIYILVIGFFILFTVIAAKLAWVAMVDGDSFAAQAQSQRTRSIDYYQYNRGDFLDTYGRKLTGNDSSCLVIYPSMLDDEEAAAQIIAENLELDPQDTQALLHKKTSQGEEPFIFRSDLTAAEIAKIKDNLPEGAFILTLAPRYSASQTAVHLIGFVREAEAGEYEGVSGLEKQYDEYLRGRSGPQVMAWVDERGRLPEGAEMKLLSSSADDTSANVLLTINLDYQEKLEQALGDMEGAAVVMDVRNGDILAMASSPKMDPYMQEAPKSDDAYVNKAFSLYPPASTFKILLALAATEENISIDPFTCEGQYELPDGHIVNCWYEEGHGQEDMSYALANSCNSYFVALGLDLGGENIKKYAGLAGLTEQKVIGYALAQGKYIDFNSSVIGDVANASIGEKGIRLSPVMVAQLVSLCANGGQRVYPRVVQKVVNSDGDTIVELPGKKPEQVISRETAAKVAAMLRLGVLEGTGTRAQEESLISVAGKTGTSQYQGVWFAGFAPAENPRWAVAVYIEEGSAGGREGAKVFSQVINDIAVLEGIVGEEETLPEENITEREIPVTEQTPSAGESPAQEKTTAVEERQSEADVSPETDSTEEASTDVEQALPQSISIEEPSSGKENQDQD